MPETLLSVMDLHVDFPKPGGGWFEAVRGVSLELKRGQTLGLVGESGSGKSLTALAIMGLVPYPGRIGHASIRMKGRQLAGVSEAEYQKVRGSEIAIVFQDPSTALNPVLNIGEQLIETLLQHKPISRQEARNQAVEALRQVQIPSPEKRLEDYPHQLSGGMKQRILISMALSCDPDCLILDEPTTALDVTVQAQLLDLIEFIQYSKHTSILLISHDLAVVSEISDDIAVIYAGTIVEKAPTSQLLNHPRHPYTRGLLDSIPSLEGFKQRLHTLTGFPPNPASLPSGCPFHPRCPNAQEICWTSEPALSQDGQSLFACRYPEKVR